VNQKGWALQYAHNDLRSDKDIVLAAVNQNGLCLQFSSTTLQNDPEILKIANSRREQKI